MRVMHNDYQREVKIGDPVETHRGKFGKLAGADPHKNRVSVEFDRGFKQAFDPKVINCRIVRE